MTKHPLAQLLPTDLDPDTDQARRWLVDELANPEYQDRRSVLQRFIDWLFQRFDSAPNDGIVGIDLPPPVTIGVLAIVFVGLALLLLRVRRETHPEETESRAVLGDLTLTCEQFRSRGLAALKDGRWGDAVIEFTRALARDAADRTLLAEAPSLTAHEIGAQLAPVFPEHTAAIARAMDLFDAVRYGRYAATQLDAFHVRDLEEALRTARPVLKAVGTGSTEHWGVPQ